MKKILSKIISLFLLCCIQASFVYGQDKITIIQDYFLEFKQKETPEERFSFFFDNPNRYNENSAYDWLDAVNVYLNSSEKINDSLSLKYYKLVQLQWLVFSILP